MEEKSLINPERIKREVICLNPNHEILKVFTWLVRPSCPICGFEMINIVKSVVNVNELAKKSD